MSKSKLTLIVDGNWLLMSRFAVISSSYANVTDMMKNLKLLMIQSINLVLKSFPVIDNVIFVADGGSWRNDVEMPSFLDSEYKGNRVKDESFDWKTFFAEYEKFMNTLAETGITVCREAGIEGDDWCYWWSRHLNADGTNVMIWSKDRDLTQLVQTDDNSCFTICWAKDSGVTCQDKNDDDFNFLFNMEYSDNYEIYNAICSKSVKVNKINPSSVIIDKIIRGDAGDNILPIIVRKAKAETSTKQYKVSPKYIDFSLNIWDNDAVKTYIHNICSKDSYKNRIEGNKTEAQIFEHFVYNRSLVALTDSVYPYSVIEVLSNYVPENIITDCHKDFTQAEQLILAERNDIQDVLDMI